MEDVPQAALPASCQPLQVCTLRLDEGHASTGKRDIPCCSTDKPTAPRPVSGQKGQLVL